MRLGKKCKVAVPFIDERQDLVHFEILRATESINFDGVVAEDKADGGDKSRGDGTRRWWCFPVGEKQEEVSDGENSLDDGCVGLEKEMIIMSKGSF